MAIHVIVCGFPECPAYKNRNKPLVKIDETHHAWVFKCNTCFRARGVGKQIIGGTIGSGRPDDSAGTAGNRVGYTNA